MVLDVLLDEIRSSSESLTVFKVRGHRGLHPDFSAMLIFANASSETWRVLLTTIVPSMGVGFVSGRQPGRSGLSL